MNLTALGLELAAVLVASLAEFIYGSPVESGATLSGGYEAWQRYRDQIVGEGR